MVINRQNAINMQTQADNQKLKQQLADGQTITEPLNTTKNMDLPYAYG
jgi:hypothetical protein